MFVPYVPEIVVEVRLEDRLVLVNPPEGLFDLLQPKRTQRVHICGLLPPPADSLQADPHHIHEKTPALGVYSSGSAQDGLFKVGWTLCTTYARRACSTLIGSRDNGREM